MIKRVLLLVVVVMAAPVFAQTAIGGTLSANFVSFNEFGQPTTHVALNLTCGLSCPTSAPELTFGSAFVDGFFSVEPTQTCGALSTGFAAAVRTTGTSTTDTTNFPAGSNFFVKARSVTCQCGNRTGEGGYIDLQSGTVNIPPYIKLVTTPPVVAGDFYLLTVSAAPRLGETVDVTVTGAGANYSASLPASDFVSTYSVPQAVAKRLDVPFTQAGTVTVTAKVTGGPTATTTFEVVAGSASGGGSGSTGGGSGSSGGGSGGAPSNGCTAVPVLLPLAMALLLRRRRS